MFRYNYLDHRSHGTEPNRYGTQDDPCTNRGWESNDESPKLKKKEKLEDEKENKRERRQKDGVERERWREGEGGDGEKDGKERGNW